jgi:prevent-host-death family protein
MSQAGIRQARQTLSVLLAEVAKGREITITDRGRPVARLVPPARRASRPFPGRSAFRRSVGAKGARVGQAVLEGRDDRP